MRQKYWLDIDFPDRPPPVYERRGYDEFPDFVIEFLD